MPARENERRLKVAIIGGGPAGLGAAIELGKLPFVDWKLYEKRSDVTEMGGGFTLQPQTWRLLEHNGAAKNLGPTDFYRSAKGEVEQRRNGRTGQLLIETYLSEKTPLKHQSCRISRAKLQDALLKNVERTHVNLSKKLIKVEWLQDNRVQLSFEDSTADKVDLLVAADGMRSVIRKICFPHFQLHYKGQSVYRTIVSKAEAARIEGMSWAPTFWKHASGLYVYTCPLGDDDFEVTARIRRPLGEYGPVSWGRIFNFHRLLPEYDDFCKPIRKVLRLAANGTTQEFALFSGAHLPQVVSHGNVAFIGDSSHALLGNFGAGAGFALEDAYTLAKTLEWAWFRERPLAEALNLFDSIRSPHYERLQELIDHFAAIKSALRNENLSVDEEIEERVKRISDASESWMYHYEIDKIVKEALYKADEGILDDKT